MFDPAGVWQEWVAAGNSKEERLERLNQVPEDMRPTVRSHVETVYAIRRFHANQRTVRTEPRKAAKAHRLYNRDNPYGG